MTRSAASLPVARVFLMRNGYFYLIKNKAWCINPLAVHAIISLAKICNMETEEYA